MNLLDTDIEKYCRGIEDIQRVEGAVQFRRMLPGLRPLYDANEVSRVRMECTAGVRVRFKSDTTRLHIAARYGASARQIFKGVAVVDGQDIIWGPDAHQDEWAGDVFAASSRAIRDYDIWLPHMCRTDLARIELDDGCRVTDAAPLPLKWLAYGDSITQGMVAGLPTTCHAGLIARELPADVRNVAVGGAKLDALLAETVPGVQYDVVSIAYGTNDFNQGLAPAGFKAAADALLAAVRNAMPEAVILLVTVLTWAGRKEPNGNGVHIEEYRAALREVAAGRDRVRLLDGASILPDDPGFFVDNIHPNDRGFRKYADYLLSCCLMD